LEDTAAKYATKDIEIKKTLQYLVVESSPLLVKFR
jgi:hypothetical protein